jgi:hypothetical protein
MKRRKPERKPCRQLRSKVITRLRTAMAFCREFRNILLQLGALLLLVLEVWRRVGEFFKGQQVPS